MSSTRIEVRESCSLVLRMTVSLGSTPVLGVFAMRNGQMPLEMMPQNAVATSKIDEDGTATNLTVSLSPGRYVISFGLMQHAVANMQLYIFSTKQLQFF